MATAHPDPVTEPTPAVRCVGLVKRFGDTVAVDGLDLAVPAGQITALLGPSGCGKTTALRMIAGFTSPDDGRIELDGQVVATRTHSVPPERRRVGMVFQDYALFPHLDVARNVAYGLRSLPRRERRARVHEVLALVGLSDLGRRLPSDLSGGQQQRVALARALAPRPDVVLLDEPFSNLDAGLRSAVRDEVRAILTRADATALVVTHDQEEALSMADHVAVMAHGRLRQVAAPQVLYSAPADRFVATFVGDADVVRGVRVGTYVVQTPIGRLSTMAPISDVDVDVVVRPEALRLVAPDGDAEAGDAVVEAVTYFGHDQLVDVRLADGTSVRSRLGPSEQFAPGDRVQVRVRGPVIAFPAADTERDAPAGFVTHTDESVQLASS